MALLGAATTWPAFSMNSALQPQLLKLEEVFDETVKAGTTIQEELKSAILLRCVGGQLKSFLTSTIGDNVQYSTLREQVMQWDRSQQKWATPWWLVAVQTIKDLCQWTLIESKMPKEKVRRARMTVRKEKVKMPRANGKKGKGDQNGKEGDHKGKGKSKDQKGKGVAWCYTCGKPGHLAKDSWRETSFDR